MIAWHPVGFGPRPAAAPWLTHWVRRALHGASQRLVVTGPHTIASGYEQRQASQYGWGLLIGWLLVALLLGIGACWLLRLPARASHDIQGFAVGTFCPAARLTCEEGARWTYGRLQGPVSEHLATSPLLSRCSVDAGPGQLAGAWLQSSSRPDLFRRLV